MRFDFQIVDGPNIGRRFFMDPESELTLGRTDQAEQVFASDERMSSQHLKLQTDHAACHIQDLGSTNGTYVNGRRIKQATLSSGDTFTVGDTVIEFQLNRAAVSNHRPQHAPPVPDPRQTAILPPPPTDDHDPHGSEAEAGWIEFDGPNGRTTITLEAGKPIVIGRTGQADIVIPDEMISSVHVSLTLRCDELELKDLDSSNGTIVRGQRVSTATLRAGDEFVAGRTTFRFEFQDTPGEVWDSDKISVTSKTRETPDSPDVGVTAEPTLTPDSIPVAEPTPTTPLNSELTQDAVEPPAQRSISPADQVIAAPIAERRRSAAPPPVPVEFSFASIKSKWPFGLGLQDSEPRVRLSSLLAAAFTRQEWLLELCRAAANQPNIERIAELTLLAILGDDSDLPRFQQIATTTALGAIRFRFIGSYGHPQLVDVLLDELESNDPAVAESAARAFTKISGIGNLVNSTQTGIAKSNLVAARTQWSELAGEFSSSHRVWQGIVIEPSTGAVTPPQLDMESQLELQIRQIYFGICEPNAETLWLAGRYLARFVAARASVS